MRSLAVAAVLLLPASIAPRARAQVQADDQAPSGGVTPGRRLPFLGVHFHGGSYVAIVPVVRF